MTAAGLSASRLTDRVSFQILPLDKGTTGDAELPLGSSAIAFSHTLASGPVTVFPGEIYQASWSWAERAYPTHKEDIMTATSTIQQRSERVADRNAIRPFQVNVRDADLSE